MKFLLIFCINILLYLSTTIRKIKNPFFYPYIHCNFFARCKKQIVFLLEIHLSPLRHFFSHESKAQKVLFIYKEYEKVIKIQKKATYCKK
jgi:hypothetical protein